MLESFSFAWVTQPEAWLAFATLLLLEIVLGIDNVIFISILAGKLPAALQARARTDSRGVVREADHFHLADLELDLLRRRVTRQQQVITLTNKEFALLHLFLRREGDVLSRAQIASEVWDMNFDSDTNVVDVAIKRLRSKVDTPYPIKLIHTVRGIGYVCEVRPCEPDASLP